MPAITASAAIDRAFTVKGAGLVVTGTALSGEVNVGDTLWLTGVNKPMRVRSLACTKIRPPTARKRDNVLR